MPRSPGSGLDHGGGREQRARWPRAWRRSGSGSFLQGALRHAGNPELISRTHFARHLVDTGVRASTNEVFRKVWSWAGLYVPHRWLRSAMRCAGSIMPAGLRGNRPPAALPLQRQRGVRAVLGVQGPRRARVEVVTGGSHCPSADAAYARRRWRSSSPVASAADRTFHAPDEGRFDLGGLPVLPDRARRSGRCRARPRGPSLTRPPRALARRRRDDLGSTSDALADGAGAGAWLRGRRLRPAPGSSTGPAPRRA